MEREASGWQRNRRRWFLPLRICTKIMCRPDPCCRAVGRQVSKKALDGVSLTLVPGLYGILGPNGAGKSTLLQIITGGLAADSGEVLWCGHPARGIGFRRILGYMPQQQGLYDSYTGRRFLSYMAALKEIPWKAVPGEVARVSQAVNLANELDKRLGAYSGGMKQRLLLASALLGDPKLLILDEPTAGLDPSERVRLRTLLAEMAGERIILVATHVVSGYRKCSEQSHSAAGGADRGCSAGTGTGGTVCAGEGPGRRISLGVRRRGRQMKRIASPAPDAASKEPAKGTGVGMSILRAELCKVWGNRSFPAAAGGTGGGQSSVALDGNTPHSQSAACRGVPDGRGGAGLHDDGRKRCISS